MLLSAGATIAPVILASDSTRLSVLGGDKTTWLVYITIGNVSKQVQQKINHHAILSEELDACFHAMLTKVCLCHFTKGVSTILQWTGMEPNTWRK